MYEDKGIVLLKHGGTSISVHSTGHPLKRKGKEKKVNSAGLKFGSVQIHSVVSWSTQLATKLDVCFQTSKSMFVDRFSSMCLTVCFRGKKRFTRYREPGKRIHRSHLNILCWWLKSTLFGFQRLTFQGVPSSKPQGILYSACCQYFNHSQLSKRL